MCFQKVSRVYSNSLKNEVSCYLSPVPCVDLKQIRIVVNVKMKFGFHKNSLMNLSV